MSLGEKLYLGMAIIVFLSFIVSFATLCWLDDRYEKRLAAAHKNADQAEAHGKIALA